MQTSHSGGTKLYDSKNRIMLTLNSSKETNVWMNGDLIYFICSLSYDMDKKKT